jgi:hypothetical protein
MENSWNFENFFQGPKKLLEKLFLTSTPGKLLEISINSRCNIKKKKCLIIFVKKKKKEFASNKPSNF